MSRGKRLYVLAAVVLVAMLAFPVAAYAGKKTIYVGKGIAKARIGMKDKTAAKKIGKVAKKVKDDDYAGQTVYCYYFGKKSGGKYAVEMYANKKHKVFGFVVNSKSYKTTKGIHVGSKESTLTDKYTLSEYDGPVYTRYHLGGNPGTDFYVKSSKVKIIQIWKS